MTREITIQVGVEGKFRDLKVNIADDDIPPFRPGEPLAVVGSRADRADGPAKVSGHARYTYDQQPAGLLHGKILRSPHPNATVKRVDLARAAAMPGVRATLSFPDAFKSPLIRFAGEGVAAVAADTEAQAEAALRAIEVEYETHPFCVLKEDAMKPDAPRVAGPNEENVVQAPSRGGRAAADTKAAFAAAEVVVEGTFDTQVQTHSSLETHGVVCSWDDDTLLCYASTQATFGVRGEMTHAQGPVAAREARVRCEYVGGGFGSKFSAGREGVAGALLAKAAGRPVKLMLDRREEHTSTGNRPDSHQKLRMALKKNGEILALEARSWGTAGPNPRGAGAHSDVIYKLGAVDKIEYGVRTNCGDARPQRAPGFPQGSFAIESLMDMAADAIGMDPLEFRKKNDDHPIRTLEYDRMREISGWSEKRSHKPGAGPARGPIRTGIGCASNLWFAAGGGGASVLVRIHRNGEVEVRNGAQDIGTGTRTVLAMMVAEELGLPASAIRTRIGDTDDPQGPGSGGSTTAPTLAPAARLAGHNAKRALLAAIAPKLGVPDTELELRGGRVVRRDGSDPGRALTFAEACALLDEERIEVLQARPVVDARQPNYDGFADTSAGVQCAEVEVDVETGVVRVTRVVAVQDAGKIINPKLAESQVRGGIIQGVSYALFERRIMDPRAGRMLNADFEHYKIAGALECPVLDVTFFDVHMGKNNSHVMGLGEPPVVGTAAAIANAVHHAIGARVMSLPITPRKVLAALGVKGA